MFSTITQIAARDPTDPSNPVDVNEVLSAFAVGRLACWVMQLGIAYLLRVNPLRVRVVCGVSVCVDARGCA